MTEHDKHADDELTGSIDRAPAPAEPQPRWMIWLGLTGIMLLSIAAGIGRMLQLNTLPAGLAEAEMQHGLLARQSGDFGLQWAIENAGPLSLPLVIVMSWIGGITGYDTETPRIAAAIFGTASILCTGLWLRRAMGPLWGIAGAAVLAASFWHILFSRLAIGQIAGTFALAALCWFLTEASARRGQQAMPWYLLSGLAAGVGFLSTPSLRLLPLVVAGILIASLLRLREKPDESEARNWLIASAATYLTISPYLIAHRGETQLWTPWSATPGLPGSDPVTIGTSPGALIDTVSGLVIASQVERGLNLPSDPWFSLLMLPWAAIGMLGLISASNNPDLRDRFLGGLGIGAAAIIGVLAVDAGHPGQLVVIGPALAGLTVYGFRTVVHWAQVRTVRYALATLIVIGIAGQGVMSVQQYADDWAISPETETALHVDVINTLIAAESLDTNEPVFVSLTGHGSTLDYFPSTLRRHTFDGERVLVFPADEDGYLIETTPSPLAAELGELLDRATSATYLRDDQDIPAYRLDARLREQMPLSAPTANYPNGPVLHGSSDPSRTGGGTVRFLLAWKSDPESPEVVVETRLRPDGAPGQQTTASTTLPANPLQTRLFQVLLIEIDIPEGGPTSDLEVRLRREDGTINPVGGMDEDGFLLLNRYELSE